MFTKIAVPFLLMAAMAILVSPSPASAAVRVGVYVGGPAYPYASPNPGYYGPYRAPVYAYPENGWRAHRYYEQIEHRRHEWRERERDHERREHEWRERERRERDRRRDWR